MSIVLQDQSKTWEVKDSDLIDGGDKDTSYTLRFITKEKYREVIRRHTRRVANKQRGMEERTEWEAVSDDLLDYALVAWKGVKAGAADAPCTADYKNMLDTRRQSAILEAAGWNQIEEAPAQRAASFREPESVVR